MPLIDKIYTLLDKLRFWPIQPRFNIDNFMISSAKSAKSDDLVLDAGAGARPYKKLFATKKYFSCDFPDVLKKTNLQKKLQQSFFCDLHKLPLNDSLFDFIICNQVLEHVKEPEKVLSEYHRILKKDGIIFLTTHGVYGEHMVPFNFFHFTRYGLQNIFEKAGFEVCTIFPQGGICVVLFKVLEKTFDLLRPSKTWINKITFLPIWFLIRVFLCFVGFCLFFLDKIDSEKKWTLTYAVKAKKK